MTRIRRFSLPLLSVFFLVVFFIAAAHAEIDGRGREIPKWYVTLGGSLTFLDSYATGFNNDVGAFSSSSLSFKPGFAFRGSFGYRLTPYISADIEATRYTSDIDTQTNVDVSTPAPPNSYSAQRMTALMGNMYLHYPNQTLFTPYAGVGAGVIYSSVPLIYSLRNLSGDVIESHKMEDWVFGYQLMLGVNYQLPPSMMDFPSEIVLGYRYLHGDDGEIRFKNLPGYGVTFENTAHNVDLAWRVFF